ncbi:MAG TPA: class I SAM-dependent methyltransferase [Alphaproteobacteria bacterium]|mgnify:CR=1 FL=1|nr:class I SAM-dependent methyltransferase [Alphaproteobacteria bacterium]MDP6269813.1 class I SAM-dependent methyltransferase [Alphaproteobacteria bacterium]MDP7163724.1 class I SAM-dependent methyltransferase [Alphaproteobacteria bacterium]MDP7427166.1 class I SAM-dependent methyltransferase [Alphaproteobacteria bacterium]HJM50207.1 class I SAM-dependent methyltransferase [Alphaproteobacteria bacterium]
MSDPVVERREHWQGVYAGKEVDQVGWHQTELTVSLELIGQAGLAAGAAVIDVGGGASTLADSLHGLGYAVTVLDTTAAAIEAGRARLGDQVNWLQADVTTWRPDTEFDLWHDRGVFHFLTKAAERAAYLTTLGAALKPGGHIVVGTFAMDGPERCSGLPVVRYDAARMGRELGPGYALRAEAFDDHVTPGGMVQRFWFGLFRRV